ncbi:MAG: GWxTD domain-containing protein [Gemmatimonadales bacterium]
MTQRTAGRQDSRTAGPLGGSGARHSVLLVTRFARFTRFAPFVLFANLSAQPPEERKAIEAFRDTLLTVSDTVVLQEREALLLRSSQRLRNDPAFHLLIGHLALRRGELGGTSHLDEAAAEFRWAAALAPRWPYAWLGLGTAEFTLGSRLSEPGGATAREARSRDAYSRAGQAFARAVLLEPGFAPRLEALARRAVREKSPERAAVVRSAFERAVSTTRTPVPRLLLALGRVQRELDDSSALTTLARYLSIQDNPAVGLIELGRALLLRGDPSGAARYLAGAGSDDPQATAEYRADLAPIATDWELAEFDRRRGWMRAELVRRFWTARDRLELRRDGERLAEHLRRLRVAQREFLVVMADSTTRLDDRGRVFVRHGKPDERASFTWVGIPPNESWRYRRGGEGPDLVLHFVSRQAQNDYRLVESVLDVPVVQNLPTEALFRSRWTLAPVYRQPGAQRSRLAPDILTRERALGRYGIRVATGSDRYPLRFARELEAWGAMLVAGGSGAQPAIQVVFAIPDSLLGTPGAEPPSRRAAESSVRVRFIALDLAGNVVASADSTVRPEAVEYPGEGRALGGRIAVPVRPGRLVAHAAIQYREGGSAFGIDTLSVPSPGAGELALGDLLLGSPEQGLDVPLGDGSRFALAPAALIRQSQDLHIATEIFGLLPGGQANLRIYVAPRDRLQPVEPEVLKWRPVPGNRGAAAINRGASSGPIVSWRTVLPSRELSPGFWALAVVVRDGAGREVRREARLVVVEP